MSETRHVADRFTEYSQKIAAKVSRKAEEIEKKLMEECTFAPKISKAGVDDEDRPWDQFLMTQEKFLKLKNEKINQLREEK